MLCAHLPSVIIVIILAAAAAAALLVLMLGLLPAVHTLACLLSTSLPLLLLLLLLCVQGSFTPLAPQLSALASTSETDAMGRFNQTGATLGTFSWKASSQCVDSVTGLPLTYNWQLVSPVFDYMVITDLALLTTPASAGLPPLARGSGDVHDQVFKAFGIDATKLQVRPGVVGGGVLSEGAGAQVTGCT
jgi:hypothetical protein